MPLWERRADVQWVADTRQPTSLWGQETGTEVAAELPTLQGHSDCAEGKDACWLPWPKALQRWAKNVPRIRTCFYQMLKPRQENYIILLWMYFMAAAAAEKAPEQWVYCGKALLLAPGFTLLPASVQWVKNGELACSHVCLVSSLAPRPWLAWCWESTPQDGWTEFIVGVREVCLAQLSTSSQQML